MKFWDTRAKMILLLNSSTTSPLLFLIWMGVT